MRKNLHIFFWFSVIFASCNHTAKTYSEQIPEGVKEITESIKKLYAPDGRVELFDVEYRLLGDSLLVKGVTTSAPAKQALLGSLEKNNYLVKDSFMLLPHEQGLEGKTCAVINLSVCNLHRKADFSSEMVTQALLGMPMKVLRRADKWYQVQTPDDYIAWVHPVAIDLKNKEEYNDWNLSEKVVVTSHYGFTYEKPNASSQSVTDVVAGNRLKLEAAEQNYYKVSYPDGRMAYIPKNICKPEKEWREVIKKDPASIIRTAYTFMGIPYLWAGTSSKGVDCSGFVRAVLYMHDIIIPRDASQQACIGERIDILPDFSNLMTGDLVFFGRKATPGIKERIVHVAIYIGDKKFIHSQGDVRIGSFEPLHKEYDEFNLNRLLFATRFLHSVGSPKVNTTLTNIYYLPQQ